jgi:antitoxin PrlF
MAPSSTISSEGQITVPLEIRDRLGLKEGDRLEFVISDDDGA